MAYNSFPYVNMHELNLDYLLNKSKEVQANVEASAGSASAAAASAAAAAGSADASLTYSRNSANSAAASEASAADSAESARIAAAAAGDPATFTAATQLTDTSKIYVYVGTTGTYTYGHWYYYSEGAWHDGGVYGTWTTDDALSAESTNAVQNKIITETFATTDEKLDNVTTSEDIDENFVNYGYSFGILRDLEEGTNATLANRLGVKQCGTIYELNMSESVNFNIRVLFSGWIERSKTVPAAWTGIQLESGKTYELRLEFLSGEVTGQDVNVPAVVAYETGSTNSIGTRVQLDTNTYVRHFTAGDALIRLCMYVAAGTTYNHAKYRITLKEVSEVDEVTPVNFRVMQYNCGMWNYGAHEDMTSNNYIDKINNYKKLFCHYHPDVMGIQEWVEEVPVTGITDPISMNSLLFDYLWSYNADYIASGSNKGRTIKSKWELIDITRGVIRGNDYGSSSNTLYCKGYIMFQGRRVCILTTAFIPTSTGAANMEQRAALLPLLLALIENEEYAFLLCDANNVGSGIVTDGTPYDRSSAEGNALNAIALEHGFTAAMGPYWPWTNSYKGYLNPDATVPIDNVFYRNNGRTKFVNMEVRMDMYNDLASDHAPCFAEFMLF